MTRPLSLCLLLLVSLPASADPARGREGPPRVAGGDSVKCTVRSIHARPGPGGIDKRLDFLRSQLSKPPFSSYKSFALLAAKDLHIPQAVTKQAQLPTKKVLKLTFKEKLLGRKNQLRLRMHLSIMPPGQTKYLPGTLFTIANRGTLLVAGAKHGKGILVVGITCEAK